MIERNANRKERELAQRIKRLSQSLSTWIADVAQYDDGSIVLAGLMSPYIAKFPAPRWDFADLRCALDAMSNFYLAIAGDWRGEHDLEKRRLTSALLSIPGMPPGASEHVEQLVEDFQALLPVLEDVLLINRHPKGANERAL